MLIRQTYNCTLTEKKVQFPTERYDKKLLSELTYQKKAIFQQTRSQQLSLTATRRGEKSKREIYSAS